MVCKLLLEFQSCVAATFLFAYSNPAHTHRPGAGELAIERQSQCTHTQSDSLVCVRCTSAPNEYGRAVREVRGASSRTRNYTSPLHSYTACSRVHTVFSTVSCTVSCATDSAHCNARFVYKSFVNSSTDIEHLIKRFFSNGLVAKLDIHWSIDAPIHIG